MNILSFDIECCDGQHICEFGYVKTDENFNVLDRGCILVAPKLPFKLGAPGEARIKLHFSEEEYGAAPEFCDVHKRIGDILQAEGQIVIGFSVKNDVRYLNIACGRYGLAPYKFATIDVQQIFGVLEGEGRCASLERAAETLGVEMDVALHKSDDDAYLTLGLLKAMCEKNDKDVNGLRELFFEERKRQRNHIEPVSYTVGDILRQKGAIAQGL